MSERQLLKDKNGVSVYVDESNQLNERKCDLASCGKVIVTENGNLTPEQIAELSGWIAVVQAVKQGEQYALDQKHYCNKEHAAAGISGNEKRIVEPTSSDLARLKNVVKFRN
jgi:hypothetical protein